MLGRGWRIGSVRGVEIRVDPSWTLVAILITYSLWLRFANQARFPGLGQTPALVLAVLTALLFFGSVLAHELAHAAMSKARGIPVHGITLFMFGGATHASMEARGPADEFLATVVGPGTSFALGGLFLAAHAFGRALVGDPVSAMFGYLAWVNIALAVFNLVPGFPLDGGRLLRSALWKLTGSLSRATRLAARVGQVIGLLVAAYGIRLIIFREAFDGLWLVVIGWFVFQAASGALADATRRGFLESTTVSQVMSKPPPTIPGGLPVAVAVDQFLRGHEGEAFPVVDDGRIVGLMSLASARGAKPDQPAREAAIGMEGTIEATPHETMAAIGERLREAGAGTVLVVDEGRLVGVVERADVSAYLTSDAARDSSRR